MNQQTWMRENTIQSATEDAQIGRGLPTLSLAERHMLAEHTAQAHALGGEWRELYLLTYEAAYQVAALEREPRAVELLNPTPRGYRPACPYCGRTF